MNTNPDPMTPTKFETALALSLNGELVTDSGAWEELERLLQGIATSPDPRERELLATQARAEFRAGPPTEG